MFTNAALNFQATLRVAFKRLILRNKLKTVKNGLKEVLLNSKHTALIIRRLKTIKRQTRDKS
jgi:hypothetical protein